MKKWMLVLVIGILLLTLSSIVFAHGETHPEEEHEVNQALNMIYYSSMILGFFTIIILLVKDLSEHAKKAIFIIMTIVVGFATLYLAISTVQENIHSVTKGPVHWHADYQVWLCGERFDLPEPQGLRNKIGTAVLHEHDDNRIHVEGAVMEYQDVSLDSYFHVVGGEIDDDYFSFPTDAGYKNFKNGDLCDGSPSTLQVYVNGKLVEDHENYVLSPEVNVPPGDCIIFEFDSESTPTTSRICESWEANGVSYDLGNVGGSE